MSDEKPKGPDPLRPKRLFGWSRTLQVEAADPTKTDSRYAFFPEYLRFVAAKADIYNRPLLLELADRIEKGQE